MIEFVQHQLEISEKLFKAMADDHKARMAEINYWADVTESLIKKLEDRDAEIARLRRLLEIQEIAERL